MPSLILMQIFMLQIEPIPARLVDEPMVVFGNLIFSRIRSIGQFWGFVLGVPGIQKFAVPINKITEKHTP